MKKLLAFFALTVAVMGFSGCREAENLKNDAAKSYENVKQGVTETKDNIDNTVQNVKDTAGKVSDKAGEVKDAADGVSDVFNDNE